MYLCICNYTYDYTFILFFLNKRSKRPFEDHSKAPLSVQQYIVSGGNDIRGTKMNEICSLSSRSMSNYWENFKR